MQTVDGETPAPPEQAARIEANIRARKDAEAAIEICGPQPAHFWQVLLQHCKTVLNIKPTSKLAPKMNDAQAKAFEAELMPYGMHKGREIGTLPTEYLCFICEPNDFVKRVQAYTNSQMFRRRQEAGE